MAHVLLLQFDTDPACDARRHTLAGTGLTLAEAEPRWPTFFDAVNRQQPWLIVIACARIPSHAFEAARYLGDGFNTRNIPVLLVDVAPKDVERARRSAPRARIVDNADLADGVRQSLSTTAPSQTRA